MIFHFHVDDSMLHTYIMLMFTCTNIKKTILLVSIVSSGFDDFSGSPLGLDQVVSEQADKCCRLWTIMRKILQCAKIQELEVVCAGTNEGRSRWAYLQEAFGDQKPS